MIRIGVPRNFSEVAAYYPDEAHKKDLYMVAWDEDRVMAICRFKYKNETVSVFDLREIDPAVPGAVLDGLIRNVLFLTAEAGCESCHLYDYPERMQGYFEQHGFTKGEGYLEHQAYVEEFFKPCPGCAHAEQ